jgi:hypothetical protein
LVIPSDGTLARSGRSPKFQGQRTRGSLTIRLRDKVREDLEREAAENGRSLSEEVEYRLERTLNDRGVVEQLWGKDIAGAAEMMSHSATITQARFGTKWFMTASAFSHFMEAHLRLRTPVSGSRTSKMMAHPRRALSGYGPSWFCPLLGLVLGAR